MKKEKKEELEKTFKEYWVKKQKIETMEKKIEFIDKEIYLLQNIYSEKEELIPSPSQAKFVPGGGRGGSSEFTPVEQALQIFEKNQLEIYKKIAELLKEKSDLISKIKKYEADIDLIEHIVNNHLDNFERQAFEQCYCYKRSNIQVGIELNCGEATIRRKRAKILAKFDEFFMVRV